MTTSLPPTFLRSIPEWYTDEEYSYDFENLKYLNTATEYFSCLIGCRGNVYQVRVDSEPKFPYLTRVKILDVNGNVLGGGTFDGIPSFIPLSSATQAIIDSIKKAIIKLNIKDTDYYK